MIENWSGQLWESIRPTHGDMLENSRDRMVPDYD